MKRKNTRALLSLALALLMTLSLLPTAFAEEAPPSPTLSSPSPSPAASPLPSPVASPGAERSPDPSPGPEKTYVAKIVREGADVSFETIDAAIADAAAERPSSCWPTAPPPGPRGMLSARISASAVPLHSAFPTASALPMA